MQYYRVHPKRIKEKAWKCPSVADDHCIDRRTSDNLNGFVIPPGERIVLPNADLNAATEVFQNRLDYRFRVPELLAEALTHKSFSYEQSESMPYNERLEFLGDAVLDLVVSHFIFENFADLPEGEMTRIRAEVVSERGLARIAHSMGLGIYLQLGRGEERSGGRSKESLLANAVEAVFGAVFQDGGYDATRSIVLPWFEKPIREALTAKQGIDHKTRLQELVQAREGRLPVYELVRAEGPDHDRRYFVTVRIDEEIAGEGQGRTKKAAEQQAARQALLNFPE